MTFNPPPLIDQNGNTVPTTRAVINGLAGGVTQNATGTTSRFSSSPEFDSLTATGTGPVSRGFIRPEVTPIPGGCRLTVNTFHSAQNDRLTLTLLLDVLDQKSGQLRTITLSVLAQGANLNGTTYRSSSVFDISYDDINQYLSARNPDLKIVPGKTTLAVSAYWDDTGHQAGGFARGGSFKLPGLTPVQSTTTTGNTTGTRTSSDLPLDMQVSYPPTLLSLIPQLKPDGNIKSRLESEFKAVVPESALTAAIQEMYRLVQTSASGDRRALDNLLGPDWTLTPVNRYWLRDDGTGGQPGRSGTGYFAGYRVDANGLPIQDPMRDMYVDDPNLGVTRTQGAMRLRSNKTATELEIKPGNGRRDGTTGILQRTEIGYELKPGIDASDASNMFTTLGRSTFASTIFNHAQRQLQKFDAGIQLTNVSPWLDVLQDRHKFTLRNSTTGVEVELSLDRVKTTTRRPEHLGPDGAPRTAEFCVVEAELDHLQLASLNQSTYALGNVSSSTALSYETDQDRWLRSPSDQVTTELEPQLHSLDDLENPAFRSTASYQSFEGVIGRLMPGLFPNGTTPGRQKAAFSGELMGLVGFDDRTLVKALEDFVLRAGCRSTPELSQALELAISDATRRATLERLLAGGTRDLRASINALLQMNVPLTLDPTRAKTRVREELTTLGFDPTPEVERMLRELDATPPPLTMQQFMQCLAMMRNETSDSSVLRTLATALNVTPPPAPAPSVRRLLGNTTYGARLVESMRTAGIDPGDTAAIEQFLEAAANQGVSLYRIRSAIASFGSSPESILSSLTQGHRTTLACPVLHAAPDYLMKLTGPVLARDYWLADDAFQDFLKTVASTQSRQEALSFANSLGWGDPKAALLLEAQAIRIAPPTLALDVNRFDAAVTVQLGYSKILVDPALLTFLRDCVGLGASPQSVVGVVADLRHSGGLDVALQRRGITSTGLQLPVIRYDVPAIANDIAGVPNGGLLATGRPMTDFCEALLAAGLGPQQIFQYVQNCIDYSSGYARQWLRGVTATLPALPVDIDELIRSQQTFFAANWTPEAEAYLRAALPQALANPDCVLGDLLGAGWNGANPLAGMIAEVARLSGVPRPAGL